MAMMERTQKRCKSTLDRSAMVGQARVIYFEEVRCDLDRGHGNIHKNADYNALWGDGYATKAKD